LERSRLDAVQGGNAQHHIWAHGIVEKRDNFRCLIALEMHENGCNDLGVFAADQLRHCA
jgi:hypothetical protein